MAARLAGFVLMALLITWVTASWRESRRLLAATLTSIGDGVLVTRVWPDSPGTRVTDSTGKLLSIDRGDVILAINGQKISSLKDYADAVISSPRMMKLTIRDVNEGSKHEVQAELRK